MLDQQQLSDYDRDGVLLVENIADAATLATLRRALAELVARSAAPTRSPRRSSQATPMRPGTT